MEDDIIENFYGVYLLYCINPKYKGYTYIGFTTDPNRRIKQHNSGVRAGGALRTSKKGPWDMVLIIHGFPNDISALRFEWAWTYPHKSRRLKDVPKKKSKELRFDFCLRVLGTMLQTKPWARLPLTVRWLKQEYYREFEPGLEPPVHMPMAYGPVKPAKVSPQRKNKSSNIPTLCWFCKENIVEENLVRCLSKECDLNSHIKCLSLQFLKEESSSYLIPMEGTCPKCKTVLLWGDVIRHMKGCYQREEAENDSHWANLLTQEQNHT
ncbi:Structure-specific endonuclease subunit slx1 [Armadillidium nasatum]|uniref:Structure-specific endonuclease subunit SLX1 homolog n=1 Tax=Armadillidium nasatum TaxID=96803 RepID=A0A5N5TBN1_9CRUS|nr:Structure-specific endonuclease subunit slx1 [Armadillidium nasatum]